MNLEKEKSELIGLFAVHFERFFNLPPLASRILGELILDGCKGGITFDEIVERTQSSKSSVSTNLNLLLKLGKITYATLPGDRRKYFKPAPFSERLDNYRKMLEFEKALLEKMVSCRENSCSCPAEKLDLKNIQAYQQHVLDVEKMLDRTIGRFRDIEKLNTNQ